MTGAERRACLDRLGVNVAWLARMTAYSRESARYWCTGDGTTAPPIIDEWLQKIAAWIERHPPPQQSNETIGKRGRRSRRMSG